MEDAYCPAGGHSWAQQASVISEACHSTSGPSHMPAQDRSISTQQSAHREAGSAGPQTGQTTCRTPSGIWFAAPASSVRRLWSTRPFHFASFKRLGCKT
eukprot:801020-Pyramimonas_sp.AAC.1